MKYKLCKIHRNYSVFFCSYKIICIFAPVIQVANTRPTSTNSIKQSFKYSIMKHIYQTMMAACVLTSVGSINAAADYWSVSVSEDPVAAAEIEAGKQYVFQSAASAKAGTAAYLFGDGFINSASGFNDKGVFTFEKANEKVNGLEVYYIKCQNGEYVALPGSASFYTKQVERAWKVVVVEVEEKNPEESYDYVEGDKDPVKYKGIDAYIWRSKVDGDELNLQKATYISESVAPGELIIASAQSLDPNNQYAQYQFLLSGDKVSIGTDYNQNAWILRSAIKLSANEALETAMQEIVPEGKTLEEVLKNYRIGSGSGEYDAEKHKTLVELWNKAKGVTEGTTKLSDEEIYKIIDELKPTYNAFVTAINPLIPGYYIITNWRGENESGYDGTALYDQGAVTFGANGLSWSGKENDAVEYHHNDPVSYNLAKFVWEVIATGEEGKFYFRNLETGRYIGPQPNYYRNITMTEKPEAAFSIGANADEPGYLTFTSDKLVNNGGIHAQVSGYSTVVWGATAKASSWHTRTISKEEVEQLKALIAQPKRNIELKALVEKAKEEIINGNVYFPVGSDGKKLESALKGDFNELDGLVTSEAQISCPMADPEEGKDINVLFDKDLGTFFHTTWHGGEHAWNAHHFFNFKLDNPVKSIVVKWGERLVANAASGSPKKVILWGAKDESALAKGKVQKVDAAGAPIEGQYDYDAWKKDGWVPLTSGTFNYATKMLAADGTENGRKVGFAALGFDEEYKYLRLEIVDRMDNNPSGFVYANELRVYQGEYDKLNSPNAGVPADVMQALQDVIKTAEAELDKKAASEATIGKFKTAYEKFRSNYPDVTRVTDVANLINGRLDKAQEGEGLGYYQDGAKEALKAARDKALADLKAITDVKAANVEEINNIVAQLNAALTTFESKLRVPGSGIYIIQSESSNKKVYHNVLSVRNSSTTTNDQVCIAGRQPSATVNGEFEDTPDRKQHLDYFWQVEKVDGGYTFRNVFNGLYLSRDDKKQQRAMMLSETPYVFKVEFINFPGAFRFVSTDPTEANYPYVNADPASKTIVTWLAAKENDNSAFSFHPVTDEQIKNVFEEGFTYQLAAKEGLQFVTLPIDAEFTEEDANGNFYTVIGQKADTKDVVLKAVTDRKLKAGQGYVFKPSANNKGTALLFTSAKTLNDLKPTNKPAEAVNGLYGTFDFTPLRENNGLLSPDRTKVVLSEQGDKAAPNAGYFGKLPETTENGDLVIPANQIITLIKTGVLAPASKTKGTFTLSGVRVDDVNSLPAGIYVINGHKVIVK